jgi:hypothetical protein
MLDQIPERSVGQLNAGIAKEIKSLNHFETVTQVGKTTDIQWKQTSEHGSRITATSVQPTLILDGFIDDFTAGIPKLRIIEKGNNHAILTVRILLKDKQTGRLLGEKNITVENARITSNVWKMVDKSAREIAGYVRSSTTHPDHAREAYGDVQN